MKKLIICITVVVILCCVLFIPQNDVIDRNKTTITVKKQSLYQKWFNNDKYEIKKYHADIVYPGTIVSVKKGSHFQGVVGKGGHSVTHYDVVIEFDNGRQISNRYGSFGYDMLMSKPITVREEWFPYYRVSIE